MAGSKKAEESAQGQVLREILGRRLPAGEKAAAQLEELGLEPTYENAISLALADKAVKSGDLSAVKYIGDLLAAQPGEEPQGLDLSALTDKELRVLAARCAPKERGRKVKSP